MLPLSKYPVSGRYSPVHLELIECDIYENAVDRLTLQYARGWTRRVIGGFTLLSLGIGLGIGLLLGRMF